MDREEIIHMARQAGFLTGVTYLADGAIGTPIVMHVGASCGVELERFAELVAAKEREECAQQVIETREWKGGSWTSTICPTTAKAIAAAIRARGATDGNVKA